MAENIVAAQHTKDTSGDWEKWAKINPEGAALLAWAMKAYNDVD